MRLIDADALIEDCQKYLKTLNPDKDTREYARIKWLIGVLNNAPTIEPERKKGEWISKGYGEYRCSSCRNIVDLDEEILMSIKMFDYCPVCGADMREDTDDKSK